MKPIIGITMGDAAGIGSEIIVKALALKEIYECCQPLVIGDGNVMKIAARISETNLKINPILEVSKAKFGYGIIDVLDQKNIDLQNLRMGFTSEMTGKASVDYIKKAVNLSMEGIIHAICTAPISKEALNKAGYSYSGHTELLAHLTKTKNYAMMLVHGSLRVVHVTTHISLKEACNRIKAGRIVRVIELTDNALREWGIEKPRIAVASLNPHSGEGGLFGLEEKEEIEPAVKETRRMGILAEGPFPADTVYAKARGGAFDAVVAMYHDQGHIPIKILGLEWIGKEWVKVGGINVTIGLPIIRTSVDHGTALIKAGKGKANPQSMIEAIKFAARLAGNSGKKD